MGRKLQSVVGAAWITAMGVCLACLVGCRSDSSTSTSSTGYSEGGTIGAGTGVTGSSASPYTKDRPAPRAYTNAIVYPHGAPYSQPNQTNPYYYYPDQNNPNNPNNPNYYQTNPNYQQNPNPQGNPPKTSTPSSNTNPNNYP